MAKAHSIALLAVGSALLAGCDGSGHARLSAAELGAQGTAICDRASAAERGIQGSDAVTALAPIVRREVSELGKLSPPAGEQGAYATLLGDFSQLTELLESLSSAVTRTGSAPQEILSRGAEVATRAAAVARPLGLTALRPSSPRVGGSGPKHLSPRSFSSVVP